METRLYLVLYDIVSPKRLRRVHRALHRRGAWTQLSCFLCRLGDAARAELERELATLVDPAADKLLVVDLGQGENAEARIRALAGELAVARPRVRIV